MIIQCKYDKNILGIVFDMIVFMYVLRNFYKDVESSLAN